VKRSGLVLALILACLAAGVFAALALADVPPLPGTTTTSTTTTTPTDTGTTATTTTGTTTTTPAPGAIPDGVSIGGVQVGGMAVADAQAAVQQAFDRPVVLRYGHTSILIAPELLGAAAGIDEALAQAQAAAPGTALPLAVGVKRAGVSTFVQKVVHRFTRKPVDAQLLLRGTKPVVTPAQPGRSFVLTPITDAVVKQLHANLRTPIVLKPKLTKPKVAAASFGPVLVIRRAENKLFLYDGMKLERTFGVATGQSAYPTPLGHFQIIVKWKNPWWYPPASPWAKGEKPTPPGPGNPLGTRWMGISSPGVGIHGTPDAASIGYSASHGCIRMRIPDAEWLFDHVDVGTPVYIVGQ
jgi:lipoprotein-anchoring transpeptidase ErfK/SrfK